MGGLRHGYTHITPEKINIEKAPASLQWSHLRKPSYDFVSGSDSEDSHIVSLEIPTSWYDVIRPSRSFWRVHFGFIFGDGRRFEKCWWQLLVSTSFGMATSTTGNFELVKQMCRSQFRPDLPGHWQKGQPGESSQSRCAAFSVAPYKEVSDEQCLWSSRQEKEIIYCKSLSFQESQLSSCLEETWFCFHLCTSRWWNVLLVSWARAWIVWPACPCRMLLLGRARLHDLQAVCGAVCQWRPMV